MVSDVDCNSTLGMCAVPAVGRTATLCSGLNNRVDSLTTVSMNTTVLSAVTLCSLVARHQSALITYEAETLWHHRQQVTAATLYDVTSTQNSSQFVCSVMSRDFVRT